MSADAPWDPTSELDEGSLEDELLLYEALAVIGDLPCDLHDQLMDSSPQVHDQRVQPLLTGSCLESLRPICADSEADITPSVKWPRFQSLTGSTKRPKKRERAELIDQRELVAELESRLARLRRPQGYGAREESDRVAAALWANVAVHQRAQRYESEMENTRLKRLLEDQIRVGKSLERLLMRERPNVQGLQSAASRAKRTSSSRTWSHAQLVNELLVSCADLYAATARVMRRFDFEAEVIVPRKVQLVHDPDDGLILQTMERRIIPFNCDEIASEMWRMFPQASSSIQDVDHGVRDDISEIQFRVLPQVGLSTGDLNVTLVKRRYVEGRRTVVVFAVHMETSAASASNVDEISMRHNAWHIIEPLRSSPSRGSVMTVYHASIPDIGKIAHDNGQRAGALTTFLSRVISTELETHHQSLENRLIARSLQSTRGSQKGKY